MRLIAAIFLALCGAAIALNGLFSGATGVGSTKLGTTAAVNVAAVTSPMTRTGNYVSQPYRTDDPAQSGAAVFAFNVTTAGNYYVEATVDCPSMAANSFFADFNQRPPGQDAPPSAFLWHIQPTTGTAARTINFTEVLDAETWTQPPKIWTLPAGVNRLHILGREDSAKFYGARIIQSSVAPSNITPTTITGIQGVPVGQQFLAEGAPTSWTAATLPSGLSLGTSGYLSGTPSASGTSSHTISAINASGTASQSVSMAIGSAATVPGTPSIGTASALSSSAIAVSFTAPVSNGGSTILDYTATGTPGGTGVLTGTGGGTINVTGLSASTGYIFSIKARNSVGSSVASGTAGATTLADSGVNYYVRAGAAGTGSGADWTNAYTALPATLVRGASYYIADGNYSGYTFDDAASGTTQITVKKATVAAHGTSTGWADSYGDGQALFSGQIYFTTGYWEFDGVSGGGPGAWTTGFGFKVYKTSEPVFKVSANNIIARHVEIEGGGPDTSSPTGNDAFWIGGNDFTASYFYAHDMGRTIIFSNQDNSNVLFEYGWTGRFESTDTPNEHSEILSAWGFGARPSNWTLRWCRFTHSEGTGGLMYDGSDLKVYGCIFAATSGTSLNGGNGLFGTWTNFNFANCKIYNNTFVSSSLRCGGLFGGTIPPTGSEFKNNLIYNTAVDAWSGDVGYTRLTRSHNWFASAPENPGESNQQTSSGSPFVNIATEDFRLSANSDAGTNLGAPYNVDMLGNTRTTWSRGAYEYQP